MPVPEAPQYKAKIIFQIKTVPADGTMLLSGGSGDFGTSPFLGSSQSRQSTRQYLRIWGAGTKAQWCGEKLISGWQWLWTLCRGRTPEPLRLRVG
jgi:hypothetical protein